ncbi:MAG: hypothetical protein HYZ00_07135, partial [Candidatus Hydrogenedentes bacterium]|nr:hypothetical protein [Candidatus Hydrogenedentota bacterium]
GNFAVREIPAGSYTLKIWREGSKDFAKEISIPAEGEAHEAIKLEPAAE